MLITLVRHSTTQYFRFFFMRKDNCDSKLICFCVCVCVCVCVSFYADLKGGGYFLFWLLWRLQDRHLWPAL